MHAEGHRERDAIAIYDTLIKDLRKNLSPDDCKMVDLRLASIQLPNHSAKQDEPENTTTPYQPVSEQDRPNSTQRYLGEASDIRFFHDVEATFGHREIRGSGRQVDSYEQETVRSAVSEQDRRCLPHRTAADSFLTVYLSTIHIAYPFISEPDFRSTYEKFWQSDSLEGFSGPWLSMLCESHTLLISISRLTSATALTLSHATKISKVTIFSLGSCYERIAESNDGSDSNHPNSQQDVLYFDLAVGILERHTSKRTVEHVCALLTQCFYLLATCQTDRCWITLGLATRIAQSIGLHVEEGATCRGDAMSSPESCRRVWYSIFVLDRLLALQLGRPPSISDNGFNVRLPSRQSDVDLGGEASHTNEQQQEWVGYYFIEMIKFSEIIGRVYYTLYAPKKTGDVAATLSNIEVLDNELLKWRSSLRRKLRFDLSHAFESSRIFQSQVCQVSYHGRQLSSTNTKPSVTCLQSSSTIFDP